MLCGPSNWLLRLTLSIFDVAGGSAVSVGSSRCALASTPTYALAGSASFVLATLVQTFPSLDQYMLKLSPIRSVPTQIPLAVSCPAGRAVALPLPFQPTP